MCTDSTQSWSTPSVLCIWGEMETISMRSSLKLNYEIIVATSDFRLNQFYVIQLCRAEPVWTQQERLLPSEPHHCLGACLATIGAGPAAAQLSRAALGLAQMSSEGKGPHQIPPTGTAAAPDRSPWGNWSLWSITRTHSWTWAKILSKVTCSVHVNDQAGQISQIAKMKNASLIHLNLSNLIAFCLSVGGWGASLESLKKSDKNPRCYIAARPSSPAAGRDLAAFTWVTHITVPMGWLQFRGSANDKQSLLYQPVNSISIYAGMKLEVQIRPATKPFQQLHLIRYCVLFTENIHHTIPTHKMRTKYKDKSCTPITC